MTGPMNPDTGVPINDNPDVACRRLMCATIKTMDDPSALPADWRLCQKCIQQQREDITPILST